MKNKIIHLNSKATTLSWGWVLSAKVFALILIVASALFFSAQKTLASTVYEYYTKTSISAEGYYVGGTGYNYQAGFFLDADTLPLSGFSAVSLPMRMQGSPTADLVLKIYNASSSTTFGSLVATSYTFDASVLPADYTSFESICPQVSTAVDFDIDCMTATFTFSSSQSLTSGDYFLVVETADASSDASNLYQIFGRETSVDVGQHKATCDNTGTCTVNSSRPIYMHIDTVGAPVDTATRFISTVPFDPYVLSADLVSGDTDVDVDDTSDLYVGQNFSSPKFPKGAYVVGIVDSDTFQSSQAPYSTGTYNLIFSNTLSTTETVGVHLYVNSADWVEGTYLEISFASYSANESGGSVVSLNDSAYPDGPLHFDIDESDTDQDLSLSQEITFNTTGSASAWFRVVRPCSGVFGCFLSAFNLFGSDDILIEKRVDFTIDVLSAFDLWVGNDKATFGGEESVIGQILENSLNTSIPECKAFINDPSTLYINHGFDFGTCLFRLFVPSRASVVSEFVKFKESVLTVFPLGYVTRLIEIFVNTDAVMPPPLEYTFSDAPESAVAGTGLEGETLSYQIYDHFDVLESIESDQGDNKNIWDIVMPWFTSVVALAVFGVMLNDVMGGGFNMDRGDIGPYAKKHARFSSSEMNHINNPVIARTEDEYNLYKKL